LSAYADTSLIVSIYLTDDHSRDADRIVMAHPGIFCTPLHLAEFAHSIEQNVFRKRIYARSATRIYLEFERDRQAGIWNEIKLPELTFITAADLARSHVGTLGVRTLDTLHVAAALELGAERFFTFDDRQKKLARAAGLKTA